MPCSDSIPYMLPVTTVSTLPYSSITANKVLHQLAMKISV